MSDIPIHEKDQMLGKMLGGGSWSFGIKAPSALRQRAIDFIPYGSKRDEAFALINEIKEELYGSSPAGRLRDALPSLAESQGDPCDVHPEIEGKNLYYSLRLEDADGIEFFHLIEANDKALAWARLLSAHPEYHGDEWSLEANEPYGMLSFFAAEAIKLEYRLQSGNSNSKLGGDA